MNDLDYPTQGNDICYLDPQCIAISYVILFKIRTVAYLLEMVFNISNGGWNGFHFRFRRSWSIRTSGFVIFTFRLCKIRKHLIQAYCSKQLLWIKHAQKMQSLWISMNNWCYKYRTCTSLIEFACTFEPHQVNVTWPDYSLITVITPHWPPWSMNSFLFRIDLYFYSNRIQTWV